LDAGRRVLIVVIAAVLGACSGGDGVGGKVGDSASDAAETEEQEAPAREVVADVSGGEPDSGERTLEGAFDAFRAPAESGASVWLEPIEVNGPDLVSLKVMARGLGGFAGVAFHLEYSPGTVSFKMGEADVDLGDSGPYFTQSVLRELEPGLLIFGVARFCKDKMPWGGIDQCGNAEPGDPVQIATLTFDLKTEGESILRFSAGHGLIRKADRSRVSAEWIGGRLEVRATREEQK